MHISDLPPEVIGNFMYYCSLTWPDAPLVLSVVSRLFYNIVRTAPRVWTNLELHYSSIQDEYRCVRKARQWFSRAGACSLHVLVDISRNLSPILASTLINAADNEHTLPLVMMHQIQRIDSLTLCAAIHEAAHCFLSIICGENVTLDPDFPSVARLRSLTLDITRESNGAPSHFGGSNPSRSAISFHFPSLQVLEITNHALSYLDIDISQLRVLIVAGHLRASPLAPGLVRDILRKATKLEHLEFQSRLSNDDTHDGARSPTSYPETEQSTLITLSSLSHLTLKTNHILSILSHLVLPGLQTLRIEDLDGRRPNAAYETGLVFHQLLTRTGKPYEEDMVGVALKRLELVGVNLGRKGDTMGITVKGGQKHQGKGLEISPWRLAFRKMKTLQDLRVEKVDIDALFDLLLQASKRPSDATGEVICPRLETLFIVVPHVSTSSVTDFQKRRPHVALILQDGEHEVEVHSLISHMREHTTNAANTSSVAKE
ncbi:hypothetical protein JOM56_004398 [Amanita muscaria]